VKNKYSQKNLKQTFNVIQEFLYSAMGKRLLLKQGQEKIRTTLCMKLLLIYIYRIASLSDFDVTYISR